MVQRVATYLGAALLFVLCVGPVALSLFASIMPDQAIFSFPPNWFGYRATFDNYRYIFTGEIPATYLTAGANRNMISDAARQVPGGMLNSMLVALGVMAVNILLGAPAAYAFARLRFRGQTATFLAIVMSRLVPAVALITPFYLLVQALHLLGTKTALIVVHSVLTLPFTVLILTIFFRRIPREIEEAALLDGCSRMQIFLQIVLPLAKPGLIATSLLVLILAWNEYLLALFLSTAKAQTMPILVAAQNGTRGPQWWYMSALIVIMIAPVVALTVATQKYIAKGLLLGAVKG